MRASSSAEWREKAVASFAASLRAHARTTLEASAIAASRQPAQDVLPPTQIRPSIMPHFTSVVPTIRPLTVQKPTVRDLTLAARRVGAEEAANRRRRTAALGSALFKPIVHAAFSVWRRQSHDGYRALKLYHKLAARNAIARWLVSHATAIRAMGRRWLRRWRVATRAALKRSQLADELAVKHTQSVITRFFSRLEWAVWRRQASLLDGDKARRRGWRKAVRLWHRIAKARATARRHVAQLAVFRALLHHAYLRAASAVGPTKLAFCRFRRRLADLTARGATSLGFATLKRRCAERSEGRNLRRTLKFAAKWHRKTAAHQAVLARLLIHSWSRKQQAEVTADARAMGAPRRLTESLRVWRREAIAAGQRRETRKAVRQSGVLAAWSLDGQQPPAQGATAAHREVRFACDPYGENDGGGQDGSRMPVRGDGAARMMLGWASDAIASPCAPLKHQRPGAHPMATHPTVNPTDHEMAIRPAPAQPRHAGGKSIQPKRAAVGEAAALLDELVGAKTRQLQHPAAEQAGGIERLNPPSRSRPFAQRRALLEKHRAKLSDGLPMLGGEELAMAAVGAALGPPPQALHGHGVKMDTAMAELRQRLSLDVPVPSYLSMPTVVRTSAKEG